MDTKLTLKLDQEIIEKAKKYAAEHKMSLSKIIATYLQSITSNSIASHDIEISPFVKTMSSGVKITHNLDEKTEYQNYLIDKYK